MNIAPTATQAARALTLCADDFGLDAAIDEAVTQLAHTGRLSATSCMSTSAHWGRGAAERARALHPRIAIGLHFNLTEPHAGHFAAAQSLSKVLTRAYTTGWAAGFLQHQWQQQLDDFEKHFGAPPDFIDGHQHVHQLPHVRQAMLAELQRRWGADARRWPHIRNTRPLSGKLPSAWLREPKAALIATLGGAALARTLERLHAPTNAGFGGVYGFDAVNAPAYHAHMRGWLQQARSGALLMCHPAAATVADDAIAAARVLEYGYLQSPLFAQALQENNFYIQQKTHA